MQYVINSLDFVKDGKSHRFYFFQSDFKAGFLDASVITELCKELQQITGIQVSAPNVALNLDQVMQLLAEFKTPIGFSLCTGFDRKHTDMQTRWEIEPYFSPERKSELDIAHMYQGTQLDADVNQDLPDLIKAGLLK